MQGGRGAGSGLSGDVVPLSRPSLTRGPPSPAEGRGDGSRGENRPRIAYESAPVDHALLQPAGRREQVLRKEPRERDPAGMRRVVGAVFQRTARCQPGFGEAGGALRQPEQPQIQRGARRAPPPGGSSAMPQVENSSPGRGSRFPPAAARRCGRRPGRRASAGRRPRRAWPRSARARWRRRLTAACAARGRWPGCRWCPRRSPGCGRRA